MYLLRKFLLAFALSMSFPFSANAQLVMVSDESLGPMDPIEVVDYFELREDGYSCSKITGICYSPQQIQQMIGPAAIVAVGFFGGAAGGLINGYLDGRNYYQVTLGALYGGVGGAAAALGGIPGTVGSLFWGTVGGISINAVGTYITNSYPLNFPSCGAGSLTPAISGCPKIR